MSTTPEAELAYALISNLQGQVYAEANEVAQMSFDIFKEAGLMVLEKGRMMKSSYVFDMEALVRQRVKVRVAKLSICPCGFPVLAKHIKLGEVYEVVPTMQAKMLFVCGGCQQQYPGTLAIFVAAKGASGAGYLPEAIFEIMDGQTAFSE